MTTTNKQMQIRKDLVNKKLFIVREFDAPLEQVWQAWTDSKLLDEWWAPKPWKAETKTMEFKEGGMWLYAMVGPDGEKHWSKVNYQTIVPHQSIISEDGFCDENGNPAQDMPSMNWKNEFSETATGTKVEMEITFANEADLQKILDMGFEEGFQSGLNNLDELLAK
jgi:uncharacterized protein YndB with AHSA1/START domain